MHKASLYVRLRLTGGEAASLLLHLDSLTPPCKFSESAASEVPIGTRTPLGKQLPRDGVGHVGRLLASEPAREE